MLWTTISTRPRLVAIIDQRFLCPDPWLLSWRAYKLGDSMPGIGKSICILNFKGIWTFLTNMIAWQTPVCDEFVTHHAYVFVTPGEEFARIRHILACVTYTYHQFWDFNRYEFLTNIWFLDVWKIRKYLPHVWKIRRNSSQVWQKRSNFSHVWQIRSTFKFERICHTWDEFARILHTCEVFVRILHRCDKYFRFFHTSKN